MLRPKSSSNSRRKIKQFPVIRTVSLCVLLCLGACQSPIKELQKSDSIKVPEHWQTDKQPEIKPNTSNDTSKVEAVKGGWLKTFNDNELNHYVDIALKNNPDLLDSASQLKSAIKQVTITGASIWPSLSANLNKSGSDIEGQNITTQTRTVRSTIDIAWEADVWGKLTQRKKAAAYSAKAQAELFKFAELSLVANVSRAWYNLITNKLQLDLAHQRLDSFKSTATLIDENYKSGINSALDVYLSRSDVQQQVASLSDARFDYIQSLRAFKTLLGQYPDTHLEFSASLPELKQSVPAGLPAQLLARRPDIKASQLNYQSEIASAKATQRDLYPSINFSGSIGDSRDSFNQLFDGDNLIRSFVSDLTAPLFAAGALRSLRDQALYSAESAYANLLTTTLTAFEEVENSLSLEISLKEQKTALQEAVSFAENGLELALDRYKLGIENYNTVLESQRRVFDSKQSELNVRNALLQNRIAIHLALGGDFDDQGDSIKILPSIYSSSK